MIGGVRNGDKGYVGDLDILEDVVGRCSFLRVR